MSSNVPLINDYKKDFVIRRCLQTFLGGLKLYLGYAAPPYVYLTQLVVWLMPWLIGSIFTAGAEFGNVSILVGSIITGCLVGVFVLCVQVHPLNVAMLCIL